MLERVLGTLARAGRAAASLQVVLEANQPLCKVEPPLCFHCSPLSSRSGRRGSERWISTKVSDLVIFSGFRGVCVLRGGWGGSLVRPTDVPAACSGVPASARRVPPAQ